MFPPPGIDHDSFFNHFNPHQEDFIQQDPISGQASLEGSDLTNNNNNYYEGIGSNNDCDQRKILRKEIERQRRQHMSKLNASLRSLLPLESIKGKRTVNDHIHEAEKHTRQLKKNIEDLSDKRDKLKYLLETEALDGHHGNTSSKNCVSVHPFFSGVQIVIRDGFREETLLLSRVLQVVVEEGLEVVQCSSVQTDDGLFHTIQSEIAVKRLKTMSAKAEMEFAVEVEILGRVRHKNLLGLRGFYAGGDERLIVYDYMPNHSLITHLHGQLASDCLLDWRRRMSIIIGSAEGLAFGVLLLEIISAKKPLEKLPGGVKRDIVQWVTPYVQKGAFDHIADPRLKGKFDQDQLKSTVMIALRCTDSNAENRPSMFEVVDWLKGRVGRRKKETSEVEDRVNEEDEDNDTYYEEYRYKIEKSNIK
ncbi:hypothetical protein LWI29_020404 [Acer saccharum]|uniref:non-specific serine/threonine protein kinase n=1 Tax=Acer saccharum TaxID=4024 RepID=A0AA39SUR9_ACESA|nr:hypothetical protein LWI29_020404 [Acer saccharum]